VNSEQSEVFANICLESERIGTEGFPPVPPILTYVKIASYPPNYFL